MFCMDLGTQLDSGPCARALLACPHPARLGPCSLFFKREMELSVTGLAAAGKTSLVNALAGQPFSEDQIPTVGFNLRKFSKGRVTMKAGAGRSAEQASAGSRPGSLPLSGVGPGGPAEIQDHVGAVLQRCARCAHQGSPRNRDPIHPLLPLWLAAAGVDALVYVVDSADLSQLEAAKQELHELLGKPSLQARWEAPGPARLAPLADTSCSSRASR